MNPRGVRLTAPEQVLTQVIAGLDPQTWTTRQVITSAPVRTVPARRHHRSRTSARRQSTVPTRLVSRRVSRSPLWGWVRRVALTITAGMAAVLAVRLAGSVVPVVAGFSPAMRWITGATVVFYAAVIWYLAVGQYPRTTRARQRLARSTRTAAPVPSSPGSARRAITGPRAVVPTGPVTVQVIGVRSVGGAR